MPDTPSGIDSRHGSRTTPADDLADVWEVLDTLPPAKPASDLTATTVELVAAKVAIDVQPKKASQPRWIDRLVPMAVILGGLVVGLVVGRLSAPDPDAKILERLPVIEHLDLLHELGSVDFLESLADQMKEGQANPPRWVRFVRDPSGLRDEAREFEATLGELRSEMTAKQSSSDTIDRRRERVTKLPANELAALEKSAATFEALTPVDRRELERLAAVLADPARAPLHEAAKQWHLVVTAINPAIRRNIIDMPSAERLEWLARSPSRYDPRPPNGFREDDRGGDRRPPGPRRDGPDERSRSGGWQPPTHRPQSSPPNGDPPRFQPPLGPPIRGPAAPPPSAPKAAPSETRAQPR